LGWFGGPLWNALTAPREPGELSTIPGEQPHLRSSLAHPTSLALTHRRPLDQSIHLRGSILGPWPARPKWTPTMVSFLGCTAHEGKSALNVTLNWALPPSASHLLFLNLSHRLPSTAVVHPPDFSIESYASFSPFARPGAIPVTPSLLPLLFRLSLSWADGSKTHRRGVQSNC
jgi:hypothetical protein